MIDRPPPRTFAIDFDATWTADPVAFRAWSALLRRRGHRVLVITARDSGHAEVLRECECRVDRVLFSAGNYNRDHATAVGESVDIWVDDMPGMIGPDIPLVDPWGERRAAGPIGMRQCAPR